jgi:hypothetical protein
LWDLRRHSGDWETSPTYRNAEIDVFHLAGTRDEFYPPERVRIMNAN